jgi:DNA (cytosine-5)-methyltransferase 1
MNKPCLIDLFCGIGSASLGFEKAGFEIAGALDIDLGACENYTLNLGVKAINEDIRNMPGRRILELIGIERGEVDLLVGCPPCQGFSSLGKTRRTRPRHLENGLVEIFAKRIVEILPKIVVFENVPGILYRNHRRYTQFLITELSKAGYSYVTDVLESAFYGVPQFRKRVVVIAARDDFADGLRIPPQTHFPPAEAQGEQERWLTVRDAIGDLPPLRAGESHPTIPGHVAPNHFKKTLEIIRNIPKDGGSRSDLPKHLWLQCHHKLTEGGAENVYGRMGWDVPSPTITTRCTNPSSGRFIHPEQDRAITPREAARLQTIPDHFEIHGWKRNTEIWIGNAMPTRLAEVLGAYVLPLLSS